ncbi:hypothetical protein HYV11_02645 [Candidatus Dependentiae bacterium]|nr:hypothetical protein [Candidatus Dependentiae bacterium]
MKKYQYLLFVTIMIFPYSLCVMDQLTITSKFKRTKEEELIETAEHFKTPDKTINEMVNSILAHSKQLQHPHDIAPLKEEIISNKVTDTHLKNIYDAFHKLKKMMDIPDEVQIFMCHNQTLNPSTIMNYAPLDRCIYVYPLFKNLSLAKILFILIHELTHAQQHLKYGLLKQKLMDSKEREAEADKQAVSAIKCPLCIHIIEAEHLLNEEKLSQNHIKKLQENGYLTAQNISEIKIAKMTDDLCEIHTHDKNLILYHLKPKEICFNDRMCTEPLIKRLSTIRFENKS